MNGQKWSNDKNESVYDIDGIFLDAKLKSIGMVYFEIKATMGDIVYHSHSGH